MSVNFVFNYMLQSQSSYQECTEVLEGASDDIMKVVLDLPQENLKPENERKKVDTGLFRQIFCSSSFPNFDDIN